VWQTDGQTDASTIAKTRGALVQYDGVFFSAGPSVQRLLLVT